MIPRVLQTRRWALGESESYLNGKVYADTEYAASLLRRKGTTQLDSWLVRPNQGGLILSVHSSFGHRYLSGMYWSLTTLMKVSPHPRLPPTLFVYTVPRHSRSSAAPHSPSMHLPFAPATCPRRARMRVLHLHLHACVRGYRLRGSPPARRLRSSTQHAACSSARYCLHSCWRTRQPSSTHSTRRTQNAAVKSR